MGYYIRVLSITDAIVPASALRGLIGDAQLEVDEGSDTDWVRLALSHADGIPIAVVERNPVAPESLGAEEIEEFVEALDEAQPAAAADWLRRYLPQVRVIHAFEFLDGAFDDDGSEFLDRVWLAIWKAGGGIWQADNEGFSNEDGHHILWQFLDSVEGQRDMAVLENGVWRAFEMDLGDADHRAAFLDGRVP